MDGFQDKKLDKIHLYVERLKIFVYSPFNLSMAVGPTYHFVIL